MSSLGVLSSSTGLSRYPDADDLVRVGTPMSSVSRVNRPWTGNLSLALSDSRPSTSYAPHALGATPRLRYAVPSDRHEDFMITVVSESDESLWWRVAARSSETVEAVRLRLCKGSGTYTPSLWWNGQPLDPKRTFRDYGIVDGSVILTTGRGGRTPARSVTVAAAMSGSSGGSRGRWNFSTKSQLPEAAASRDGTRPPTAASNASSSSKAAPSLASRLRPLVGTTTRRGNARGERRGDGMQQQQRYARDIDLLSSTTSTLATDFARQVAPGNYRHLPPQKQVAYLEDAVDVLTFRNAQLESFLHLDDPLTEMRRLRAMSRHIQTPSIPLDWALFEAGAKIVDPAFLPPVMSNEELEASSKGMVLQ